MLNFSLVDGIIVGIITLSVITGLVRGFIKELIALSIWIVAIWLGYTYCQVVGKYLSQYISNESAATAAGFIVILLGVVILGSVLNACLSFILSRTGLSGTDRFLGMIFGFVRGAFIVSLFILAMKITDISLPKEYINNVVLYDKFNPIVEWMYAITPDYLKNKGPDGKEDSEEKL